MKYLGLCIPNRRLPHGLSIGAIESAEAIILYVFACSFVALPGNEGVLASNVFKV